MKKHNKYSEEMLTRKEETELRTSIEQDVLNMHYNEIFQEAVENIFYKYKQYPRSELIKMGQLAPEEEDDENS